MRSPSPRTPATPPSGEPALRPATAADAPALARFGAACFRDAYGADCAAADIDAHVDATYAPGRQEAELADPAVHVVVAELAGQLAGYALLRLAPAPVGGAPGDVEIGRFYLARPWHGSGLAQRLMAFALDHARARGGRRAWLQAWDHNARAIAFYRRQGFAAVAAVPFLLGSDAQTDVMMVLQL